MLKINHERESDLTDDLHFNSMAIFRNFHFIVRQSQESFGKSMLHLSKIPQPGKGSRTSRVSREVSKGNQA